MSALDDLLGSIFSGITKPFFYTEFEGWVRTSRRFRAFATTYGVKIRAKLKNARDAAGLKDLWAELETAAILLHEERFTLEYEKYTASKQRGPDFTVTFKTHTLFNVEVRRVRSVELDEEADARVNKLMAVFCDKVRQMPAGIVNVLWLVAERDISEEDLNRATSTLRQLAESKNEEFFMRRGFKNASDYLKHYGQLGGVILHQSEANVIWLNSLARHKIPPEIINAFRRLEP